jgi:hypothetical protein
VRGGADCPGDRNSLAQVARDLGINPGTLGNWVAKDRAQHDGIEGLSTGDATELKRLRRETSLHEAFSGEERIMSDRATRARVSGPLGPYGDGFADPPASTTTYTKHVTHHRHSRYRNHRPGSPAAKGSVKTQDSSQRSSDQGSLGPCRCAASTPSAPLEGRRSTADGSSTERYRRALWLRTCE